MLAQEAGLSDASRTSLAFDDSTATEEIRLHVGGLGNTTPQQEADIETVSLIALIILLALIKPQ